MVVTRQLECIYHSELHNLFCFEPNAIIGNRPRQNTCTSHLVYVQGLPTSSQEQALAFENFKVLLNTAEFPIFLGEIVINTIKKFAIFVAPLNDLF